MSPTPGPHLSRVAIADRIVIAHAGPSRLVDLMRLATVRSDDIVVIGDALPAPAAAFARRFALRRLDRPLERGDLAGVAALLVSGGDEDTQNEAVALARRVGVPVHVIDRPLLSDFSLIAFLERAPEAVAPHWPRKAALPAGEPADDFGPPFAECS